MWYNMGMNTEEKRDWVTDYYESNPPSDCVYIDDADVIRGEVERFVDDFDDVEIAERYDKFKGTKDGKKVTEHLRYLKEL